MIFISIKNNVFCNYFPAGSGELVMKTGRRDGSDVWERERERKENIIKIIIFLIRIFWKIAELYLKVRDGEIKWEGYISPLLLNRRIL